MDDDETIKKLLVEVWSTDRTTRHQAAASLSKVAAKANDAVLEELSTASSVFVELLAEEEPLLRAYTACILANIAFLEIGQQRVLDAGGVAPLVRLLRGKPYQDRKVTLHSTAAIQNLTYKSEACCEAVLREGGEKALKKLLQHKSEDIQQFAAGALANLQLYRRSTEAAMDERGVELPPTHPHTGIMAQSETSLPPTNPKQPSANSSASVPPLVPNNRKNSTQQGKGGKDGKEDNQGRINRKVKQILRRKHAKEEHGMDDAAILIQSSYRGHAQRRKYSDLREERQKRQKYDVFRVKDVRAELAMLPPLNPLGQPRSLPALSRNGGPLPGAKPHRLQPLPAIGAPLGAGAGTC